MSVAPAAASLRQRFGAAALDWIVPEWPAPPRVQAFSTTRNGPGGAPFDASPADAAARALLRRWLPAEPVWLAQVHGCDVCDADVARRRGEDRAPRADAAVARAAGTVCGVLTADCIPVLLADTQGSVVAAAHAGWRGLAAGVLEATLAAMGIEARRALAWLGPAIGPQAFEVGADVVGAHCAGDSGASACFRPLRAGKWLGDLYALARRRLARAGVAGVYGGDRCTFAERAAFHSYRRDGAAAGRMASFVWLAARQ